MKQRDGFISWSIFITLSFVWGSSFILMKIGLYNAEGNPILTAYQLAAIRMLSGGIVLLPFLRRAIKQIPLSKLGYVLLSGLLGSFFPAFLFCIAETKIDSGLTGTLNALTPLFVSVTGFMIYHSQVGRSKIIGILVGLAGCIFLLYTKETKSNENIFYSGFVILATICYGLNVNMVRQKLADQSSVNIATMAFAALTIPSLIILIVTGYFDLPLSSPDVWKASTAGAVLGVAGTAIASILYYILIKKAGPIFASMVTYGIPFIAIGWGVLYGEQVTILQIVSLIIILAGVFIASKS